MHVMMTKEQFDMLKQKAKSGGGKDGGEEKDKAAKTKDTEGSEGQGVQGSKAKDSAGKGQEKLPKITLKEDDDTHGTLDTDDVMLNYYYNPQEGRLYLSIAKKHTLAAYCAGDNISGTYVMDILSQIPNPQAKSGDNKSDAGGGSEGQEKKDQSQQQPPHQNQHSEQHQSQ